MPVGWVSLISSANTLNGITMNHEYCALSWCSSTTHISPTKSPCHFSRKVYIRRPSPLLTFVPCRFFLLLSSLPHFSLSCSWEWFFKSQWYFHLCQGGIGWLYGDSSAAWCVWVRWVCGWLFVLPFPQILTLLFCLARSFSHSAPVTEISLQTSIFTYEVSLPPKRSWATRAAVSEVL